MHCHMLKKFELLSLIIKVRTPCKTSREIEETCIYTGSETTTLESSNKIREYKQKKKHYISC